MGVVAPVLLDEAERARVEITPPEPVPPPPPARPIGYHGAVWDFKKRLIEATLHQVKGNRTHAARALGLQRTYLLRLIRDLGVASPPSAAKPGPMESRAS